MDKFTLTRTLRNHLQQASVRDVRIEESDQEARILDEYELALAAGGEEVPTW